MFLTLQAFQADKRALGQATGISIRPHVEVPNLDGFVYKDLLHTVKTGHVIKDFALNKIDAHVKTTVAEEALFSNPHCPEDYAKAKQTVGVADDDANKPVFQVGDKLKVGDGKPESLGTNSR